MNPTIDLGRQRKGTTEEERKQKGERGSFLRPDPGSCYDILFHFRVSEVIAKHAGWGRRRKEDEGSGSALVEKEEYLIADYEGCYSREICTG